MGPGMLGAGFGVGACDRTHRWTGPPATERPDEPALGWVARPGGSGVRARVEATRSARARAAWRLAEARQHLLGDEEVRGTMSATSPRTGGAGWPTSASMHALTPIPGPRALTLIPRPGRLVCGRACCGAARSSSTELELETDRGTVWPRTRSRLTPVRPRGDGSLSDLCSRSRSAWRALSRSRRHSSRARPSPRSPRTSRSHA